MNDSKIAVRYSKALFDIAKEKNILPLVRNDATYIIQTISGNKELIDVLKNPVISSQKKLELLKAIFESSIQKLTLDFINLLCENQRELFLERIFRHYIERYRKHEGITNIEITTAHHLEEKERTLILKRLHDLFNHKIDVCELVDPELIGGIIINFDYKQLDVSVRTHLSDIKKELKQTDFYSKNN